MNPIISPKNKSLPEHIRKGEYYENTTRKKDLANYNKDDVKVFDDVETAYDFAIQILAHYEFYYLDKKPSYDNAANFGSDVLTWCKKIQRRKGE